VPPGGDERRELERKLTELAVRVKALAARKADPAIVADVDIYDAFMDAIRWTKSEIEIGTRTFSAADHVPVLIYPNPLYPRLGDYSVVKANGDVALSGFFDEQWRFK
jgi:hypothetical protein